MSIMSQGYAKSEILVFHKNVRHDFVYTYSLFCTPDMPNSINSTDVPIVNTHGLIRVVIDGCCIQGMRC